MTAFFLIETYRLRMVIKHLVNCLPIWLRAAPLFRSGWSTQPVCHMPAHLLHHCSVSPRCVRLPLRKHRRFLMQTQTFPFAACTLLHPRSLWYRLVSGRDTERLVYRFCRYWIRYRPGMGISRKIVLTLGRSAAVPSARTSARLMISHPPGNGIFPVCEGGTGIRVLSGFGIDRHRRTGTGIEIHSTKMFLYRLQIITFHNLFYLFFGKKVRKIFQHGSKSTFIIP